MRLRFWRRHPPAPPPGWLSAHTGRDARAWIAFVQARILARSRPSADPNHDETDVRRWMRDVVAEVHGTFPRDGRPYDGNMRMAAVLGMILVVWYVRVHHAKAFDPARPVGLRQQALSRLVDYETALLRAILDEREDAVHFPGQIFEPPYTPDATEGSFV